MGISGHDKFEGENRNEGQIHYNSANLSSDWPFTSPNNLTNTSSNPIDNTSSSSASMADSFCQTAPTMWDHHPTNLGNLVVPSRNLEMSWAPPNSAIKGGDLFLPQASSTMIPHSLSQIPADSGFIERAARYSCFGAGNFGDMINPFGNVHESLSPFNRTHEGFVWNGVKSASGEGSKDASMAVDCDRSQLKNERQSESFVMSIDETKCAGISGNNGHDEAEFSEGGGGGQEENSNEGFGSKRRRKNGQDIEYDQVRGSPQAPNESTINNSEVQEKGDNNPNSRTNNNKSSGKHGKSRSQASDTQKEEYIHVRARRGQATNSHSLAERVRREKISERMKFLQDLVPGCNKVTGKAVMLDEIINYVQSLQRQVEFLSMKLATVNPRMDFSIENLLAKDMVRSQAAAGGSGGLGFGAEMAMSYHRPLLHPSQTGIMQSGVASSSDAVRRTINSHLAALSGGGYKDPNAQVPNAWDDELHNIVQMGLNPTTPLTSQDLGSTPPGHLKTDT